MKKLAHLWNTLIIFNMGIKLNNAKSYLHHHISFLGQLLLADINNKHVPYTQHMRYF